jgi:hypothetical protein
LYILGEFRRTTPAPDSHPVSAALRMSACFSKTYFRILEQRFFPPTVCSPSTALPGCYMWQGCINCRYCNYSRKLIINSRCVGYSRLQVPSPKRLWNKVNSSRRCYLR